MVLFVMEDIQNVTLICAQFLYCSVLDLSFSMPYSVAKFFRLSVNSLFASIFCM